MPLVKEGKAVPLFSWGVTDDNGNLVRDPAFPDLPVFEFSFSNDRRLISSSSAGAAHPLDVGRTTCTAAAGSMNTLKLEAFAINLKGDRLLYC